MTATSPPIDINPTYFEIVRHILDEHVPDCEVRAFGSRATWVAKDYSDLDLAVVGDKPLRWSTLGRLKDAFEESTLPFRVDVLDWHDISDNFRKMIEADCTPIKKATATSKIRGRTTLGETAEIVMGQSPPGSTVSTDGGIPLLNGPSEFGVHHPTPVQFTTDPRRYAQSGDILFCVRGSTGRMNWADQEYAIGRGLAAIRHRKSPDLQPFLRAVIEHELPYLLVEATGSIFSNISARQLQTMSFSIFSESEQRDIAHILGTLDDKIELNRRMNETLEAMAQALFKSWFVDFDPVRAKMEGRWRSGESLPGLPTHLYDLFPDRLVSSELGEIPEGWKVRTLGALCNKPQYGYTASAEGKQTGPKFLRITDINKTLWVDWETVPYCKISKEHFAKYFLAKGDILIARIADPGHGCMIEEEIIAVFASYLIRFRPISEHHTRFIQYWLRSDIYWKIVRQQATGTTRVSLSAKVLGNFPLISPPTSVTNIFNAQVDSIRSRVVANVRNSHALAVKRDILLSMLLSGRLQIDKVAQQKGAVT